MKLDYKILWLDDKMEVIVEGQYDYEIKKHLLDQDFNPILITVNNEKDFFNHLDDSFDLILTDYHLNETGSNVRDGDKIVKEVREKNAIFTEIMFYSAQGDAAGKVELDRITFVDTKRIVGNDHYEKLITRAIKLIDLTIRKFQTIIAMRGMIMHETSSLDLKMDNIVKNFISNPANKEQTEQILAPIFDKIEINAKEKYDRAKSRKPDKILKDNVLFSASQKIFALGEILKKLEIADFSGDYNNKIIWYRNQFAHAELMKNSSGKEYFKVKVDGLDDELIFDEILCKEIRKNINTHRINFENLDSFIK